MFDAIGSIFGQVIWLILLAVGGLAAAWGYGRKKRAEGRAEERERARVSREAAAKEAAVIREKTAAKTTDQQRKDLSKWEK